MKIIKQNSELEFGKYKGKTFDTIIEIDANYAWWLISEYDGKIADDLLLNMNDYNKYGFTTIENLFEPEYNKSTYILDITISYQGKSKIFVFSTIAEILQEGQNQLRKEEEKQEKLLKEFKECSRYGVYLIVDDLKNIVKIGEAKNCETRLKTLQTANPDAYLFGVIRELDKKKLEKELHNKFKKYHYKLEWYHYNDEIINYFKNHKNFNDLINKKVVVKPPIYKAPIFEPKLDYYFEYIYKVNSHPNVRSEFKYEGILKRDGVTDIDYGWEHVAYETYCIELGNPVYGFREWTRHKHESCETLKNHFKTIVDTDEAGILKMNLRKEIYKVNSKNNLDRELIDTIYPKVTIKLPESKSFTDNKNYFKKIN